MASPETSGYIPVYVQSKYKERDKAVPMLNQVPSHEDPFIPSFCTTP